MVAGTDVTVFLTSVSQEEPGWLKDHAVFDQAVVPATAFVELAHAAGCAVAPESCLSVKALVLESPCILPEQGELGLQVTVLESQESEDRAVQIYSRPEGEQEWMVHASATLAASDGHVTEPAQHLPPPEAELVDVAGFYQGLALAGLSYGPSFQGLSEAWREESGVIWARIALGEELGAAASEYGLHPALLDAAFHAVALAAPREDETVYVPFEVGGLDCGVQVRQRFGREWSHRLH